ncbi:Cof-type HAD-IIB family hydrolase [Actinomycetaceae bacterium L2_0104]
MTTQPTDPTVYSSGIDPRLIVTDMDGTLLDDSSNIPERLWALIEKMKERGIVFVPASGRQYFTLASLFEAEIKGMPVIAENGAYVVRDGEEISSIPLERDFVVNTVELLRSLERDHGRDLGIVVAGKKAAYVERSDEDFMYEVRKYYHSHRVLPDQLDFDDDILKIAIFDFDDAESGTAPFVTHLRESHAVVISGEHWIDIMDTRVNKGTAVRSLQKELGVSEEQTVVFGDYLNDLEMIQASGPSFATANAHPDIIAAARYLAPSNSEEGVIQVLENILRA